MLTFEFEDPSRSTCECCGGMTTRLTRFVYRDNDAYAIYYAMFSDNHADQIVKMLVSLGEWGEDSDPNQRKAFALDLRVGADQYEIMVTDASESPWHEPSVLGRILDREEALRDALIDEVFHITDHAVEEDEPLKRYLEALDPRETDDRTA
jgi:hypothetical protein